MQIKRQWHVSLLISSHIFYRKIRHSELSSQFEIITLLHIFYNKESHCPEKSTSYLTYDSIYYISNNLEIIGLLIYLLPIHFNLKNNNTCCTKHKIMSILIYNYSLGRKKKKTSLNEPLQLKKRKRKETCHNELNMNLQIKKRKKKGGLGLGPKVLWLLTI